MTKSEKKCYYGIDIPRNFLLGGGAVFRLRLEGKGCQSPVRLTIMLKFKQMGSLPRPHESHGIFDFIYDVQDSSLTHKTESHMIR
jgi:hypothetical protein